MKTLTSNDPFYAMVFVEYALDVAMCEMYAHWIETALTPEIAEKYEKEYFFWDGLAFTRANIIGHDLAVQITAMVLSDIEASNELKTVDMYMWAAKEACTNFRDHAMNKPVYV